MRVPAGRFNQEHNVQTFRSSPPIYFPKNDRKIFSSHFVFGQTLPIFEMFLKKKDGTLWQKLLQFGQISAIFEKIWSGFFPLKPPEPNRWFNKKLTPESRTIPMVCPEAQGKDSLDGHIHGWDVESLKHGLGHLFHVFLWVGWSYTMFISSGVTHKGRKFGWCQIFSMSSQLVSKKGSLLGNELT